MRVLAFDQATKLTGLAVYDDGKLVSSGLLDHQRTYNIEERFNKMSKSVCGQIDSWKPDLVIFEDTDLQTNPAVMKKLANMQGVIMGHCILADIPYLIYKPQVWRSKLGFKQGPKVKRDDLKVQAMRWATDYLGWEPQIDQAEAICIGAAYWKE